MTTSHHCQPLSTCRTGAVGLAMLVLLTIVLTAAGGVWWWRQEGATVEPETNLIYKVERGDFSLTVTERGEVESSEDIEIRCEVKAKNTQGTAILRLVPEGSHVKKDDFLIELDASALESEQTKQQIAVNRGEATMIEARNGYETAVIAKQEYIDGTFVQEKQTIESEIFVAEENLSRSKEYLKYSERLAAKGHITEQQLEADAFAVEKSQKELEAAKTKLNVLEQFTQRKMVTQLKNEILTSKAKWDAEKASYELELEELQKIIDQVGKCLILAPDEGIVMYAHESDRHGNEDFIVEPGAVVRERQIILRMPNKEAMQVRIKVNESLIKFVHVGAQATISPIGLGSTILRGAVDRVSEYSEPSGWRKANVKEYRAYVRVDEMHLELRSGMTASVTIECQFLPDVLQIPVQSLYAHGGQAYCFVRNGNGWDARQVQRGPTNDKFFVIDDGISAGDVVALNPRKYVGDVDLPELSAEEEQQAVRPGPRPKQPKNVAARSAKSTGA